VQRGRDTCGGCGQTRDEDTPMLTCSGCRVADLQRISPKDYFEKSRIGRESDHMGTRISAECSASGARLSKTVLLLFVPGGVSAAMNTRPQGRSVLLIHYFCIQ
jgi:hypothetical protein